VKPPLEPHEVRLEFAPNRYVVFSHFMGKELIHIREYAVKEAVEGADREYPTKKGVSLTAKRLKMLKNRLDDLDGYLKAQQQGVSTNYRTHLGAAVYAAVGEYDGVDLRRYWIPEGQGNEVPTKRGIFVPVSQWSSLKRKLTELMATNPHLEKVNECFHQNQLDMMDCPECSPYGWLK